MIVPIVEHALQNYIEVTLKPNKDRESLPSLRSSVLFMFPEMAGDTQAINAISKSISAAWNIRKSDNTHHNARFKPYYEHLPKVLLANKAPKSLVGTKQAPEVIADVPVAEKSEVVTQHSDSVPVSINCDGIINVSGDLTYDDCMGILNIIYKRR
jgi:hypothetical protein